MLAINRNSEKIGKFFNYPENKIDSLTSDDVNQIILYKNRMLEMVQNGLLTCEEYSDFIKNISRNTVSNFVDYIGIYNMLFSVPLIDLKKEANYLFDTGFIPNLKEQSDITKVSSVLIDIRSKISSISFNFISMETDTKFEDKIETLENLLSNLKKEDSDVLEVLRKFYIEWVEKTFSTSSVKKAMLELIELFINENKKVVLQMIGRCNSKRRSKIDNYVEEAVATSIYKKMNYNKKIRSFDIND